MRTIVGLKLRKPHIHRAGSKEGKIMNTCSAQAGGQERRSKGNRTSETKQNPVGLLGTKAFLCPLP